MLERPSIEESLTRRLTVLDHSAFCLRLLRALLVDGPSTCMQLAKRFHATQSRAWNHLENLRGAGFVERQGQHKGALWTVKAKEVYALFAEIAGLVAGERQNGEAPGLY